MINILEIRSLVKSFGALRASDGIDLDVRLGETHAIIGPNGAGKTTLIGQLAGDVRPDRGSVRFAGEDVTRLSAPARARKGLARSFQITSIYPDFSALGNVMLAVQAHAGSSFHFWKAASEDEALRAGRGGGGPPQAPCARRGPPRGARGCPRRISHTASSARSRSPSRLPPARA